MAEMWAVLMGAVVAGGIALLTQWLGGRQSRSATLDDERAARLSEFLAATQSAVLVIGDLARLPIDGKDPFRQSATMTALNDRVNTVLNAIQLLDNERVVAAVLNLDRSLVRLKDEAIKLQWTRAAWRLRRNEVLGDTVDLVHAAGRAALRREPIDRSLLWSSADLQTLQRVGDANTVGQRPPYGS